MAVLQFAQALARRAHEKWKAERVPVLPPQSVATLDAFERRSGVALPADLRLFFLEVGGCGADDSNHLRLWGLDELEVAEEFPHLWVFADYMAWTHAFAVDLRRGAEPHVYLVAGAQPRVVAPSFSAFLMKYLETPSELTSAT